MHCDLGLKVSGEYELYLEDSSMFSGFFQNYRDVFFLMSCYVLAGYAKKLE